MSDVPLVISSKNRTAAILVIGNEVLSGKVKEANVAVAAALFFELGIALKRVVVCVDDVEVIAADVKALSVAYDIVFTSGGIGPTHDDMTNLGVAAAFGRGITRSEELALRLRTFHQSKGRETTEAHLRMADVIDGARLLYGSGSGVSSRWPTHVVENVYILPGVPQIFAKKMDVLREELDHGQRLYSKKVYTRCNEGAIADLLDQIETRFEGVAVGSYLAWEDPAYSVLVTFDGRQEKDTDAAAAFFVNEIGALFVSFERPSI